jgi:hypothetical protein
VGALVVAGALTAAGIGIDALVRASDSSGGKTVVYWIAAVPVSWNIVPNGHDAMTEMPMRMPMPMPMPMPAEAGHWAAHGVP